MSAPPSSRPAAPTPAPQDVILHALAVGVLLLDGEGRILWSNRAAERLLGLTEADRGVVLLNEARWQWVDHDGQALPAVQHPVAVAMGANEALTDQRIGVIGTGRVSWLRISLSPPFHESHTPSGWVATLCDVTNEVTPARHEDALRDAAGTPCCACGTHADVTRRHDAEAVDAALPKGLERSRASVRQPIGLLSVCAWCRRVRADAGDWTELEEYLHAHTQADVTHGICPDCERRFPQPKG